MVFGGSRTSTPFLEDVPSVLAAFVKNKKNEWGARKQTGKTEKNKNLTVFKKLKNDGKIAKTAKNGKIKVA